MIPDNCENLFNWKSPGSQRLTIFIHYPQSAGVEDRCSEFLDDIRVRFPLAIMVRPNRPDELPLPQLQHAQTTQLLSEARRSRM